MTRRAARLALLERQSVAGRITPTRPNWEALWSGGPEAEFLPGYGYATCAAGL